MKNYIDSATGNYWAFEDDILVSEDGGVYSFSTPDELALTTPLTLKPIAPLPQDLLLQAQTLKLIDLNTHYTTEIQKPITYRGSAFQADLASQDTLNKVLTGSNGVLPNGFYWVDAANTKVDFTIENLHDLSTLMLVQGWAAFQTFQDRKMAVKSATTVAAVNEVVW